MKIEFYKIIAEIIPIFFLAVTLQSTFLSKSFNFKKSNHEGRQIYFFHLGMFIFLIITLGLGEFTALKVVYTNEIQNGDLLQVVVALMVPGVWITAEYIQKVFKKKLFYFSMLILVMILALISLFFI